MHRHLVEVDVAGQVTVGHFCFECRYDRIDGVALIFEPVRDNVDAFPFLMLYRSCVVLQRRLFQHHKMSW